MLRRFALLLILLLAPRPALAWWEYGHETVALIAEREVRPETRARLRALLARSALLETPACPAGNIAQASYWADCIKTLGDRFSFASPWHYQNVDVCRPFDQEGACRDGNCVSAQIERHTRLLADGDVPERERVMALAFLIHLVGDLHQPLHAGDRGDRGGNGLRIAYGLIAGRTNLHLAWDGYLAERAISTPAAGAAGILGSLEPADKAAFRQGSVTDWARENWEVSRDFAYAALLGDPCGAIPDERPVIDEATTRRLIPIVRRQVARGGIRLARLLDEALA
ncbi:S1/P1 nuclease [Sphingosinicella sp. CPCC 101087]|uniref:S1/P1 nuclease n=1 Tax=Sphingosinicella sp. CPCC 101087 TaxID=2497754 RepID=UPI00197FFA43|nr:S1/P1 nuclease [Sphingosinicella sp. CPCC 101087]